MRKIYFTEEEKKQAAKAKMQRYINKLGIDEYKKMTQFNALKNYYIKTLINPDSELKRQEYQLKKQEERIKKRNIIINKFNIMV